MAEGITPAEMMERDAQELADFLSSLCRPPSNEPTDQWAEKNVIVQDGPFAGSKWRLEFTPFAKWIFEAMRKPGMKRVVLMFSAQYVKTMALIIDFLRNASEDPADTMWVMAEADQMADFIEKRLYPYIESCVPVARYLKGKRKFMVQFEGMNLLLRGSNSRAKLQSDPIRRIYCDERREWKKGSIDILRKRMRTFPNALEISAGTAGNENDELHYDYNEGTQTRAHIRCLKCGHSQPIRFGRDASAIWKNARECGGFIWETSERTRPNGEWNWEELSKTVFFECENPACRERYSNNQKYDLIRTMHPHDYNPNAPKHYASFGGSAFEAIWESCDWDKLVIEFLKAVEQAKLGNIEPMKAFITETLGEPWQDRLGVIDNFGFLEARKQQYEFGDEWPECKRKFIAADPGESGGKHWWWVARGIGYAGKSRLLGYGKAVTLAELDQVRKDLGISAADAMIDTGHYTQECYRFCLSTGWKAFKGDGREFYLVPVRNPKNPQQPKIVRRIWLKSDAAVYNGETKHRIGNIPLFLFCNDPLNELLAEYQTGLIGEWSLPEKVGKVYLQHMTGEQRAQEADPKGRIRYFWKRVGDNHLRDCERMIKVAAIITKTINAPGELTVVGGTPSKEQSSG